MEPLKPTGFWSYTSQDDTSSRGRLSQLRRLLADELQGWIGRSPQVHIFQDVAAIPPGSEWEQQIHEAIDSASFLIPIVTPGFLQSEWCGKEVLKFRAREQMLGRDDLIFPLYYLDVEDFATIRQAELYDAEVLRLLRSRQWVNFRDLRHTDPTGEEVAKRISRISLGVHQALYRRVASRPASLPPTPTQDGGQTLPPPSREPSGTWARKPDYLNRALTWLRAWTRPTIWTVAVLLGGAVLITVSRILPGGPSSTLPSSPPAGDDAPDNSLPPEAPQAPVPRSFLVFFDWDRADLTPRARQIVAQIADSWKKLPDATRIEVNGYNDTSQSQQRSLEVSIERAKAVAAELVRDGVPQSVIDVQGFGGTHLLVPTGQGVREPQNRRAEIIIR